MNLLDLFKSLADPCRLRLLAVLLCGEFTVQELTRIFDMGQSRISRHLKILTEAGILTVKRQGTWSYYRAGNGNDFLNSILPALKRELEQMPRREEDLAALARILEDRRKRSQEFFDQHARQWDDLARTLLPLPDYLDRLVSLVPNSASILEVGTGTGILLPKLSARAESIIGVDNSPAMLDEARRRMAVIGITNSDLRLGDMMYLPLPDSSVGCVVANMVLHHAADPGSVVQEFRRVLSSKGVLVLADLVRHERESARDQLADQWLGFETDELLAWLQSAGFDDIVAERITGAAGEENVLLVRGTKN